MLRHKRYLLIPALLLAGALAGAIASAQTVTVTVERATRHAGAGTGMVLSTHPDEPACRAAIGASAPDGASVCKTHYVKTTTAAPATWTRIAVENGSFTVPANSTVRYGAGTSFRERVVSGVGQCTTAFFGGSDPAWGITKACDVRGGTTTPPPPPPTCREATPPLIETRACGSGFTGTQSRTTTYVMGPPTACVETSTVGAWTGTCTPIDNPPPPPTGTALHFSDCQPGAAPGCVPGSNSNPGTQAAPKQNLAGINLNTLPPGSLLFNRGGAWVQSLTILENTRTNAAAPLVFDAYGSGPLPLFQVPTGYTGNMFNLGGNWNNTSNDGGYTFRNIKFDGRGTADWGFWFVHTVRDVVIENSEITGFRIGINSNDSDAHGVTGVTLRNNHIHHNRSMGLLGHYNNMLIEGNLIEANNFSGSGFDHGTYIGGGNNITVRNNRYLRNSTVNGVCQGGNMTFHGQIDGLLIEGNRIEQDAAAGGCWLVSITTGYTSAEWFRNAVVRNNKMINGGNNSMVAQAAPGIVVEDNVAINTRATNQVSFNIGGGVGAGDTLDANAVVRNNTACQSGGATGSVVSVNSPGATVSGNTVRTGAEATTGICAR